MAKKPGTFEAGADVRRNAGGVPKVPGRRAQAFCEWAREQLETDEAVKFLGDCVAGRVKASQDNWLRWKTIFQMLPYAFGRPPQVAEPGEDAIEITADQSPRLSFSNNPIPQDAADWMEKHAKPADATDDELAKEFGLDRPPATKNWQPPESKAKPPVQVPNGAGQWPPPPRWPPIGER